MELVEASKKIIEEQVSKGTIFNSGESFSKYQKMYLWTNENINEYMDKINLTSSKVLTVMGSGDHTFNLIANGILNIDTFDTNSLTEYFVLGLKYAMILKYDYNTFINIMEKLSEKSLLLDDVTAIFKKLLPFMDDKYRKYWDEIIEFNYKIQKGNNTNINLIHLLFINIINDYKFLKRNNYLLDEEHYNMLKNNINKANIVFKNTSAIDLDKEFCSKYKYIFLSNILDYFYKVYGFNWDVTNLDDYLKKLGKLSDKDSIIFLNYIFMFCTENFNRKRIINNSSITKNDIDCEIKVVNNVTQPCKDGIILIKR